MIAWPIGRPLLSISWEEHARVDCMTEEEHGRIPEQLTVLCSGDCNKNETD